MALDVGCAVGASAFELSKYFDKVLGIDYSSSFVTHCKKMQLANGVLQYESTLEGEITQKLRSKLDADVVTYHWVMISGLI